jgi:hypothetical protein
MCTRAKDIQSSARWERDWIYLLLPLDECLVACFLDRVRYPVSNDDFVRSVAGCILRHF